MPPAETIEEAFRDTSALPTSLLMGWLLASSLYKRDRDEERMKSKREHQELEEDVAQLKSEVRELQDENQYVVEKCKEVAEQVTTQCDEEKQELMERLRQARNARGGTQRHWTERVRDVVQDTQPLTEDKTESYVMPKNDCSLDTFAATLASLTTEKQIKDYVNTFLVEFSMWCSGERDIYGPGIKEIKRLEKARLMEIR